MAQLDHDRERIQQDLRGLISGDVRCDDVFRQLYASDGSIFEIQPLGVVRPRSTADVAAAVQYAAEKQIPIHARGAGTGLAGESLGLGLVVDFSRHLARVKYTGDTTVRVQPGLGCERLNAHLRPSRRFFGPGAGSRNMSTMGGMISLDGAGSRWLKYGTAGQHVVSMQVVLADGQVLEVGREPLVNGKSADPNPRKREMIDRLVNLLTSHGELIRSKQPKAPVNRCGYHVAGVLGEDFLDLARLLAGSEGTLALVTEAVVNTQPLPRYRGVALLLFDSLEKASRAVMEILPHGPSACDLMDRRHLSLARETEIRFDLLIPTDTEAALLVEHEGGRLPDVRHQIHRLVEDVHHRQQLSIGTRQAFDAAEIDLFWHLAHRITPTLYRSKSATRPVPVIEDVAVPPELLPDFLVRMQNVLKKHQVIAATFAHAGQGQLHIQPFLNLAAPEDVEKIQRVAEDLYDEVLGVGGTLSAEHACGLSRTPFVRRQYGELVEVFREIKRVFDPQNVFNPGKVVSDEAVPLARHLRPPVVVPAEPPPVAAQDTDESPTLKSLLELQLSWEPAQVADVVRTCNGCGDCRSQASGWRMCPIFRFLPSEEASPRAKANLIRGVLTGQLPLTSLSSEEFKAAADLCVNCHACAFECPARVDIPKLMLEGKGAYVAANGLSASDWVMSRLDWFCRLGCRVPTVANWALRNRQMRWLLEKTLGIAQGRKLPPLASRTFIQWAGRRRLIRPSRRSGHKVVYFVDVYANYCDPRLGRALVAVMEHNGVAVYVPPEQTQGGMPAVSSGALDTARQLAARNVKVLAEAVRQGYHVVTTEPAAALCLSREYLNLFDDEDTRLVSQNTSDAGAYLWKMHTQGRLQLDLEPISATLGYHMPCRLKALQVGSPGENLLRLVPGLTVHRLEEGCSGMAGTFGLKRENYRASLRAGWSLIRAIRNPNLQAGTTECSTCKIQMEQGTNKPTIHPIKLLALAYGLMPETLSLLTAPGKEAILS
jgi:FAD/FMN-containing dehydrogenase/Fe-S oxidoreductase